MWNKTLLLVVAVVTLAVANCDMMYKEIQSLTNSTDVEFYMKAESRIINGQQAQRRQLPWHVIVEILSGNGMSRLCAGSLISSHFVLSEANALRGAGAYDVIIGAHQRTDRQHVRRSTSAFFHPNHVPGSGNYNIALIQLQRGFTEFSKYVRPVQLANPSTQYEERHTWISGYGTTSKLWF